MSDYLYRDSSAAGLERLRGLQAVEDPDTIQYLEALEVSPGMSCLEVGAGGGSIANWLALQVKPSGVVVATETDVSFLDSTAYEVWRHDIRNDALPAETFDVVHLRHLFIHIPAAEHPIILRRLYETLRPRGKILIEESDLSSWAIDEGVPEPLARNFSAGVDWIRSHYRSNDIAVDLGAALEVRLDACGFVIRRSWRRCRQVTGGSPEAQYQCATVLRLKESVGAATPDGARILKEFCEALGDARVKYRSRTTASVFAQKL